MNETLVTLACLFYEVHSRFYRLEMDEYYDAMTEVANIASSLGYTLNDLAKVAIYS